MKNSLKVILFILIVPKIVMAISTVDDKSILISNPILTIDTGSHQSRINRNLITTSDGHYLVSASIDKTIRVWNIKTKKEVRKILGQVGNGVNGVVDAIALSPNDKWLAVGGFFGEKGSNDSSNVGSIRIYDFNSGELVKLLISHDNAVTDLYFSNDGAILLSSSADYKVKVWNVDNNFQLSSTLQGHTGIVYAARALPDEKIVSVGLDGQLLLWDHGKVIAKYKHINILDSLAINNNKIVASGQASQQIMVFDHQLNLLETIESKTKPFALKFSPNGRYLLTGTPEYPFYPIIYDSYDKFSIKGIVKKYDDLVEGIGFLDNNTIITGGGSSNDIYFWDIDSLEMMGYIAGNGNSVHAVGIDNNGVKWGNMQEGSSHNNSNQLEYYFDLKKSKIISAEDLQPISTKWGDWSLSHRFGENSLYNDAILVISNKGKEVARIIRDGSSGLRHLSYGFTSDGLIISGGNSGFLVAYNRKGKKIFEFSGHTGDVLSIAVSNNKLISGSSDQTIKVWNISKLKDIKPIGFLTTLQEGLLKKSGIKLSIQEIMKLLDDNGGTNQYLSGETDNDRLIASFFFDNNSEWVVWTKSGYYISSKNGAKYIGFHINHGSDKAAGFVPISDFHNSLYRPDIVKLTWKFGSEDLAIINTIKD